MGLWLSMNWRQELARQALADRVPAAMLDQLWPHQTDVPAPDAMNPPSTRFAEAAFRLAAMLPHFPAPYTMPQSASNEWAVDGRHTATGAPLLAGDPHLAFSFPGIWYLARIDMPGRVLAGAHRAGRAVPGARAQRKNRLDIHHHWRGRAGHLHRDAGRRGRIPDPGWPEAVRGAGGTDQGPRSGRRGADGARNPARAGDQRSGPSRWPDPGGAMGNLQPAHGRGGAAGAEPGDLGSGGRDRGRADHFAGAEPVWWPTPRPSACSSPAECRSAERAMGPRRSRATTIA